MMKLLLSSLTLIVFLLPTYANADSLRRRCKRFQPKAIGIHASGTYLEKGDYSLFRSRRMAEEAGYTSYNDEPVEKCDSSDSHYSGTWFLRAELVSENCSERGLDVNEEMVDRFEVNHSGRLVVVSAVHSVGGGAAHEDGFSFHDTHIAYHYQQFIGLVRAQFDAELSSENVADVTASIRVEIAGLSCEMNYKGTLQRELQQSFGETP